MESKLAQYRAQKQKEREDAERNERYRDLMSLGPLRRRLFPPVQNVPPPQNIDASNQIEEVCCFASILLYNWCSLLQIFQVIEELPPEPLTPIDWAIRGVAFVLWALIWYAAVLAEFGAVYFVTSCFAVIYLNLGERKKNQPSAYSVFNKDFERIDGTFTAEQFEKELLHKR